MPENFYLDPDLFSKATNKLHSLGERLEKSYSQLSSTLAPLEGCWGDDEIGNAFSGNYVKNADDALTSSRDGANAMQQSADNMGKSSEQFQRLDDEAAERLDRKSDGK